MQTHKHIGEAGFSLIEIVMVLVIIASLSVVAVVRFGGTGEQTVSYQADLLANQIRHMQGLAMAWGVPLKMNILANSYNVQCVTASATAPCNSNPIYDPAAFQSFSVTLQNGVGLTGTNFEIDSMGRPRDAVTHTVLPTALTLSLTTGAIKWNITINPITADLTLAKV